MTIEQLKVLVEEELNGRNLKSKARFYALDKVIIFIKKQYGADTISLPTSKTELKVAYENDKGEALNGAENSVINELYYQLENARLH